MPEEAKRLLSDVHDDVPKVIRAINGLITSQRLTRKVLVAVIVVVLLVGVAVWRITAWAVCTTDRANALNGPGTARINLFFSAYTNAAGQKHKPLTAEQKTQLIAGLDKARQQYTVIPKHAALMKSTEFQLLAYRDLIASLRKNVEYNKALKHHPVCSVWGF